MVPVSIGCIAVETSKITLMSINARVSPAKYAETQSNALWLVNAERIFARAARSDHSYTSSSEPRIVSNGIFSVEAMSAVMSAR